jgi:polyisoprenoid-binding protein YceI
MTRRRIVRGGLAAFAVVVAAGAAVGWWVFLRDDTPSEAALVEREVVADPSGEMDGRWVVRPGEGVFAGYRITEEFGAVHNTAVARTGEVEAAITVEGTQVTEVTASVDMASLTSQDNQVPGVGNRDEAMRTMGLQTDDFPTATFTSTEPVELGELPAPGQELVLDVPGDLELHGVSRPVTLPVTARWNGEVIDLSASLEVALADHDIDPPAAQIVTVAESGTLELQLTFARAD